MRLAWPDGERNARRRQEGSGKPWLTVQSLAAIPLKAPLARRLRDREDVSAVEQKDPSTWSRGDVVRVRLEIDAQSDMTWVVVSDPIPGGATILGGGLGRDSQIATRGEKAPARWPAFEERSFEAFRSYYEYLPQRQARRRVHRAPQQPRPLRACRRPGSRRCTRRRGSASRRTRAVEVAP